MESRIGRYTPKEGIKPPHPQMGILSDLEIRYNDQLKEFEGELSRSPSPAEISVICRSRSAMPFLNTARSFDTCIGEARGMGYKKLGYSPQDYIKVDEYFGILARENLFGIPIAGTTLRDIEEMSLPLQEEDIRRMNRMLRRIQVLGFNVSRLTPWQRMIQSTMVLLPTQTLLRPREIAFPLQLKPLNDRLTGYFDYYLPYMVDGTEIDRRDELAFFSTIVWEGSFFYYALSAFTAARLGLTPASVLKAFERSFQTYTPLSLNRRLIGESTFALSHFLKPGGLPAEFDPYQLPNQGNDFMAGKLLSKHYEGHVNPSEAGNNNGAEDLDTILARFGKYHKTLRSTILNSPEGYIRYDLTDHPYLGYVMLASQYRRTLLLIGIFSDGKTHLTLEINGDGNLYGIPQELRTNIPGIDKFLARDIISPILTEARIRHPHVEPAITIGLPKPVGRTVSHIKVDERPQQLVQSTKRRNLPIFNEPPLPRSPLGRLLSTKYGEGANGSSSSEESAAKRQPAYAVVSEEGNTLGKDDIRKYADRLARNDQRMERDIGLIIRALSENPYGSGSYNIKDIKPVDTGGVLRKLRSFRGDKQGLRFEHSQAEDVRVIYYIVQEERKIIILEIIGHGEFDKKFHT